MKGIERRIGNLEEKFKVGKALTIVRLVNYYAISKGCEAWKNLE